MFKQFHVVVNGKDYQVAVEEVTNEQTATKEHSPIHSQSQSPPASVSSSQSAKIAGKEINAPMPGTILNIKKEVGDIVKAGEPIVILEAMKMENDIVSPIDGKLLSVLVKTGDAVNSNDVIAIVGE